MTFGRGHAGLFSNHNNASDFTPNGIRVTGNSTVEVGNGATLDADTVDLSALISKLHAAAHAGAEAILFLLIGGAAAYAEANVWVDTNAQVVIHGDFAAPTTVTGAEGVDLRALTQDVNLERLASRLAVALVPLQEASAGGTMTMNSVVTTERYVTVVAGARAPDTVLQKPDSDLGHLALFVDARVAPITALVGTFQTTAFWGTALANPLQTDTPRHHRGTRSQASRSAPATSTGTRTHRPGRAAGVRCWSSTRTATLSQNGITLPRPATRRRQ